jgi:alpha-tubulin suppressor-like RCC1 family protein
MKEVLEAAVRTSDPEAPMTAAPILRPSLPALAGALALLLAGACADDIQGPHAGGPDDPAPEFLATLVVSNPVASASPDAAGATSSGSPAGAVEAIAYVSLPPGTVPNGETAVIRTRRTAAEATAAMVGGGFDPIPVAAASGDTLDIRIELAEGEAALAFYSVVPDSRAPVVVRTDPPPRKPDVPLNAVMLVVFSEPIDAATLTASAVQLLLNGAAVAGTLQVGDGLNLTAVFAPDEPLAPGAAYTLVVTQAIRDLDGEALAEELRVEFTTVTDSATGVWAQVSTGDHHTCAVTTGGSVYCWGSNFNGQLGIGSTSNTPFPARVAEGLPLAQVSAGGPRTCGLTSDGVVYCWGAYYDLGEGPARLIPTLVAGGATLEQLSVGGAVAFGFVSAIAADGVAYCWGRSGCWGYPMLVSDTPYASTSGVPYAQVNAGYDHACGVTTDLRAYCWGANFWGQFGDGTIDDTGPQPERPVAGELQFAQVSAGGARTCGITTDGVAYCWGTNWLVGLGDGTTEQRLTPTPVAGDLRFAQISVGSSHTCGVTTDHVAYCWGINHREYPAQGQLGDGTTEHRLTPTPVAGGLRFRQVSAGGDHTCGITTDGDLYCWGFNWSGQLGSQFGYGTGGSRLTPTPVEPPS